METLKKLYRIEDVVLALGVSRAQVYRYIGRGALRVTRLGRSVRIDPRDLDDFIEAKRAETQAVTVA